MSAERETRTLRRAERNSLAPPRRFLLAGALGLSCCLLTLLCLASPALAAKTPPAWKLTVTPHADYFLPGEYGVYKIEAENVGETATKNSEPITIEDVPPVGTSAAGVAFFEPKLTNVNLTAFDACPTDLLCKWPEGSKAGSLPAIAPHQKLVMFVLSAVPATGPGSSGPLEDVARISGGGAAAAEASASNVASPEPPFGKLGFASALTDSSANPYTQAGGHPYQFTTEFNLATYTESLSPEERLTNYTETGGWAISGAFPVHDAKEISSDLPPGLFANPQGVPTCSLADFFAQECPLKTAVGNLDLRLFGYTEGPVRFMIPVLNLQPTGAYPGELGALFAGLPLVLITASVRSGGNFGITATSTAAEAEINRLRLNLWGVPADPSHDKLRAKECSFAGNFQTIEQLERACESHLHEESNGSNETGGTRNKGDGGPADVEPTPFLTMPTECSGNPLPVVGRYNSWASPAEFATATAEFPAVDGCNALSFTPTIEARPTTNLADAPSGFDFSLHIPQEALRSEPEVPAEADLKEATVTLPPGLVVNPSSGQGLQGCSPAQIGLTTPVATTPAHFTEAPENCPDASKLGTVEVNTPLLHNPLLGSVFLATPHQSPSGALLAGYIVLEGEGVIIKLAGQFHADPVTGQITAGFLENPQTPFEDFKFHFFGGALGALRTPPTCGTYTTHAVLTPYSAPESGPPAQPSATFDTSKAADGSSTCPKASAEVPYAPRFTAGTKAPLAGAYSPFSLKLVRDDGSQELARIDTTLPPGLTGKLAGVGECSEAQLAAAAAPGHSGASEQSSPSCPASSEVGSVDVAAGAGPTPLNVSGRAYLAGPYKGAPLSLAIITPAVAGPFDLGTVVVRTALFVEPESAQIHAVSDEIPHILEGIPLDVRSVTLKMSRHEFTLNPTNCEELHFSGAVASLLGQSAPLAQRFQVGGCKALGFKPKLSLAFKGGTKRTKHPALKSVLTYPKQGSYANIAKAAVTLPHSEIIDPNHIGNPCTRPVFVEGKCPKISVLGRAKAWTPLLDKPLEGKVYFRSNGGERALPDVVADLNGQIHVVLVGAVDTVTPKTNPRIRTTFFAVPDAPVSKFVLELKGGKEGLLVNSENLCKGRQKAVVQLTAQNGKAYDTTPAVANSCGKAGKKKHGKGRGPSHRLGTMHR